MSLRFHEIAETYHRILNPFSEEQLILLGEICRLHPDFRLLDLACGKGEMLCRWVQLYGVSGVGVDISSVFLDAARKRASELGVIERLTFVQGDAAIYPQATHDFDVVSCIGATWIGDGLDGTIELMKPALKPGGLLLVGEPFWIDMPPEDAYAAMSVDKEDYVSLDGTLDRFKSAGLQLVEMVLANHDGWDRYEAPQWMAVDDFIRANPDDPDAAALGEWISSNRRAYLKYGRRYFGWGVFVLRPAHLGSLR
jgi:ubiquinone/menaquinone biosynthesis C-methylase UbiE